MNEERSIDVGAEMQSTNNISSEAVKKLTLFDKIRTSIAGKELLIVCIAIMVILFLIVAGFLLASRAGKTREQSPETRLLPTMNVTPTNSTTPTTTSTQAKRQITVAKNTIIPTADPSSTPTPSPTIVLTSAPTSTPLPTPIPTLADTQAPVTNITYPQQNGEITYFTDSKVCATMSAPTDNVTSSVDIITHFAFDSDGYSQVMGTGYLCRYELLNGAHTLRYKSQDRAGNMEAERTLSFVVNIPGNMLATPTPTATPSNQ